jgi:hypothetical protein
MKRHVRLLLIVLFVILLAAAVLLAPWGFQYIGKDVDWSRLSDIGQAYGGISALISSLALAGVSASLLMQARQVRTANQQLVRSVQFDFFRILMENPRLYVGNAQRTEVDARRNQFYAYYFNYAQLGFEMGVLTEANLRNEMLANFFASERGRRYWENNRSDWMDWLTSRSGLAFIRIVDDTYAKASASGRPEISLGDEPRLHKRSFAFSEFAAGLSGGALLALLLRRSNRESH